MCFLAAPVCSTVLPPPLVWHLLGTLTIVALPGHFGSVASAAVLKHMKNMLSKIVACSWNNVLFALDASGSVGAEMCPLPCPLQTLGLLCFGWSSAEGALDVGEALRPFPCSLRKAQAEKRFFLRLLKGCSGVLLNSQYMWYLVIHLCGLWIYILMSFLCSTLAAYLIHISPLVLFIQASPSQYGWKQTDAWVLCILFGE